MHALYVLAGKASSRNGRIAEVAARDSGRLLRKRWNVKCGNHKHHAPVRTMAEQPDETDAAEPVPRNRQSAVYYRETINKNGKEFGDGRVGDGWSDWALGG